MNEQVKCDGVDTGERGPSHLVVEKTKFCRPGTLFLSLLAIKSKRGWPAQGRVGIILFLWM